MVQLSSTQVQTWFEVDWHSWWLPWQLETLDTATLSMIFWLERGWKRVTHLVSGEAEERVDLEFGFFAGVDVIDGAHQERRQQQQQQKLVAGQYLIVREWDGNHPMKISIKINLIHKRNPRKTRSSFQLAVVGKLGRLTELWVCMVEVEWRTRGWCRFYRTDPTWFSFSVFSFDALVESVDLVRSFAGTDPRSSADLAWPRSRRKRPAKVGIDWLSAKKKVGQPHRLAKLPQLRYFY